MSKQPYQRTGEIAFSKIEKVNSELFTLTYGALVAQLMKDFDDVDQVNAQLEKMGYNIGQRLIDEFLAKSNITRCSDFKETAEIIAKVGFKMFLGVIADVANWNQEGTEFSLLLGDTPLTDFVELPENCSKLYYSNILSGVIRGSLEMVNMRVETKFVRCTLQGDDVSEIRVTLKEMLTDEYPDED
eukprot:GFYU01017629.1.p1 GENE.GFYU01017629.1~~GFYU01017629.1.p1  ORF type:complete len:197 (-),score=59.43 GFYU01017629.1:84-641(-)